jgi:hypothetical protein
MSINKILLQINNLRLLKSQNERYFCKRNDGKLYIYLFFHPNPNPLTYGSEIFSTC